MTTLPFYEEIEESLSVLRTECDELHEGYGGPSRMKRLRRLHAVIDWLEEQLSSAPEEPRK